MCLIIDVNKFLLISQKSCQKLIKKNHSFKQWCETHKDCERLRLMDLLVKPMQRLTKYSLLLKAILKKTDSEEQKTALKRMVRLFSTLSQYRISNKSLWSLNLMVVP